MTAGQSNEAGRPVETAYKNPQLTELLSGRLMNDVCFRIEAF